MSCKIDHAIYRDHSLFVCLASGQLPFERLYQHIVELMTDTNFKSGLNGIYDFTKVQCMSGDINSWGRLAAGMKDTDLLPSPASTAIVLDMSNQELFQTVQHFINMAEGSLIDYKIFDQSEWKQTMAHVGLKHLNNANVFFEQLSRE